MNIVLIIAAGLLFAFVIVVIFLKIKNDLSWASAFREAFEYLCFIF